MKRGRMEEIDKTKGDASREEKPCQCIHKQLSKNLNIFSEIQYHGRGDAWIMIRILGPGMINSTKRTVEILQFITVFACEWGHDVRQLLRPSWQSTVQRDSFTPIDGDTRHDHFNACDCRCNDNIWTGRILTPRRKCYSLPPIRGVSARDPFSHLWNSFVINAPISRVNMLYGTSHNWSDCITLSMLSMKWASTHLSIGGAFAKFPRNHWIINVIPRSQLMGGHDHSLQMEPCGIYAFTVGQLAGWTLLSGVSPILPYELLKTDIERGEKEEFFNTTDFR